MPAQQQALNVSGNRMDILRILKKKGDEQKILQANATLYPDKILIDTTDRVKEGFGIASLNFSILPTDIDNEILGQNIRHHLSLTKTGLPIPTDYKQAYNDFLNKAGFKNGKEHHKDALHLIIFQKGNQITISPTQNGGYTGKDRGFLGMKDVDSINVSHNVDDFALGVSIRDGWRKCK
jgi:hypothetical protein